MELLALVQAVAQWRAYLWTPSPDKRPFLAVVDHGALLWLATAKDAAGAGPASRLQRWFLKLSEYNMEIKHRPGRLHHCPDFISRMVNNGEYQKLLETPEHISWLKVNPPTPPVVGVFTFSHLTCSGVSTSFTYSPLFIILLMKSGQ